MGKYRRTIKLVDEIKDEIESEILQTDRWLAWAQQEVPEATENARALAFHYRDTLWRLYEKIQPGQEFLKRHSCVTTLHEPGQAARILREPKLPSWRGEAH